MLLMKASQVPSIVFILIHHSRNRCFISNCVPPLPSYQQNSVKAKKKCLETAKFNRIGDEKNLERLIKFQSISDFQNSV